MPALHSRARPETGSGVTTPAILEIQIAAKGATPVLDRLAREGVRFADATTQAPLTAPAHAAILTGLYPARFGMRDNATAAIPAASKSAAWGSRPGRAGCPLCQRRRCS